MPRWNCEGGGNASDEICAQTSAVCFIFAPPNHWTDCAWTYGSSCLGMKKIRRRMYLDGQSQGRTCSRIQCRCGAAVAVFGLSS